METIYTFFKTEPQAVLLHNGNTYAAIAIAHSMKLIETYMNLQIYFEKIKSQNINGKLAVILRNKT